MSWKDKGNEKFKAGLYTEALKCYNKALDDDKENAVLYRFVNLEQEDMLCGST